MHPVTFFMQEIYQDYWGIPENRKARVRRTEEPAMWFRSRPPKQDSARR